jgi:hypothetical protein
MKAQQTTAGAAPIVALVEVEGELGGGASAKRASEVLNRLGHKKVAQAKHMTRSNAAI